MHLNHYKLLLILLLLITVCFGDWETFGCNSQRTSFIDAVGPESPYDILWEGGSLPSDRGCPILISNNKLVTMRICDANLEYAPLICHDLYTGDTLWSRDFPGGDHSVSAPLGFRNNVIYAANWLSLPNGDTLYAIDAETGETIWQSDIGIVAAYYIGIAFTENGDLILPLQGKVSRINHLTGDTVWSVRRIVPVTPPYCGLAVLNQTAYGWASISNELQIIAINIETGEIKYGMNIPTTNPPENIWNAPLPVVSSTGIVYMYRPEDNLSSYKDTGDSLSMLWYISIRKGGLTKPSVGPDGSVYFANHDRIMRADPLTGNIIDSSIIIWSDTNSRLIAQFAIDANGTVFLNVQRNVLYSFNNNLQLIWKDSVDGAGLGSPILSNSGLLAVAGKGDLVRVYRPVNLNIDKHIDYSIQTQISNFSSFQFLTFTYHITHNTNVRLLIYNTRGRLVYRNNNLSNHTGNHTFRLNLSNNEFAQGSYIYNISIGNSVQSNTFIISK